MNDNKNRDKLIPFNPDQLVGNTKDWYLQNKSLLDALAPFRQFSPEVNDFLTNIETTLQFNEGGRGVAEADAQLFKLKRAQALLQPDVSLETIAENIGYVKGIVEGSGRDPLVEVAVALRKSGTPPLERKGSTLSIGELSEEHKSLLENLRKQWLQKMVGKMFDRKYSDNTP